MYEGDPGLYGHDLPYTKAEREEMLCITTKNPLANEGAGHQMSGICSNHQGHDPNCVRCTAIPLTEEKKAYYKGYEARYRHMIANCWTPVENCVLNVYTKLEQIAQQGIAEGKIHDPLLEQVLKEIDHLRELKRGMWVPDLKQ